MSVLSFWSMPLTRYSPCCTARNIPSACVKRSPTVSSNSPATRPSATRSGWHALWSRALGSNCESDAERCHFLLVRKLKTAWLMRRTVPAKRETQLSANIREDFLRLEQNWLQLVRSYETAQLVVATRW